MTWGRWCTRHVGDRGARATRGDYIGEPGEWTLKKGPNWEMGWVVGGDRGVQHTNAYMPQYIRCNDV